MRTLQDLPGTSIRRKVRLGNCLEIFEAINRDFRVKEPRMPHSRNSLAVFPGGRRVLEPPPGEGLGEIEVAEFRRVIASCPSDHFSAEDVGLLCSYVRARVLERRSVEELLVSPAVAGTQNP